MQVKSEKLKKNAKDSLPMTTRTALRLRNSPLATRLVNKATQARTSIIPDLSNNYFLA